MAIDNTVLDNSANDYAKKAAQALNNEKGAIPSQVYPSTEVKLGKMFGKFNQQNTATGMEMSGEKRTNRR